MPLFVPTNDAGHHKWFRLLRFVPINDAVHCQRL